MKQYQIMDIDTKEVIMSFQSEATVEEINYHIHTIFKKPESVTLVECTQNETIDAQPTTKDIEVQETLETAKEMDVLPHKTTMTYEEAKEYKQLLEDKNKADGKALKVFDQYRNAMGIVPDHIRELPEYKKAKESCDKSFSKLREFNAFFVKNFKKEYAADRKNRYKAK